MKQQQLLKNGEKHFGGEHFKRRKGRGPRPLATKQTMHLVLRSTQAVGTKSFTRHRGLIKRTLDRFAKKYAIKINGFANVGNHLHVHLKLTLRHTWRRFIRAFTAAIAVTIGGKSRWAPKTKRFWDRRPFTRVVIGWHGFKTLRNYIRINECEGHGVPREVARKIMGGIP